MSLVNLIKNNVFGTTPETRYCPVCSYLGDFDASGSRKNSICPKCASNERARLYFLYLMSVGFGKTSCKALHIL
ncbi:MAG: anaerobic ribonucleoside-triphosphate reductase, partial [archaeon]|nr:anaerobic ribonucleoside-triphosphate reductase [archaeon]